MKHMPLVSVGLVAAILLLSPAWAESADVLQITPSGGDDTNALQTAFDAAVAAGPGSTVMLGPGSYCVTAPIIVRGFDGNWVGAGLGKTIVRTCAHPFPVPVAVVADPVYPSDPLLSVREPFVFLEVEGGPPTGLHVRDLSLRLQGTTEPYFRHGNPGVITLFQNAVSVRGKRPTVADGIVSSADVSFERVEIAGEAGGLLFGRPSLVNVIQGVLLKDGEDPASYFPGDFSAVRIDWMKVDFRMSASLMSRVGIGVSASLVDSTVTIGGSSKDGNTFDTIGDATRFLDMSNSKVEYSWNRGTFMYGPRLAQGVQKLLGIDRHPPQSDLPFPALSTFVVTHNDFDITSFTGGFSNGVEFLDLPIAFFGPDAKTADVLVAWNKFNGGDGVFAAVDGYATARCLVQNNQVAGNFLFGIALGYDAPPPLIGVGCTIQGNNLQKLAAGLASILLGPFSSDNTVVGGPSRTGVLDLGTGNVVTGVSNMNGSPPGPALQDALARRRALLEAWP